MVRPWSAPAREIAWRARELAERGREFPGRDRELAQEEAERAREEAGLVREGVREDAERRRELHLAGPLDGAAMRDASARLVGRKDFSSFAAGPGGVHRPALARMRILRVRLH